MRFLALRNLSLLLFTATCAWSQGVITTVVGNGTAGFSGDNGQATQATIGRTDSVATDAAGNLYFQDETNHRVRKVDHSTGVITTIAGNGSAGFSGDNGLYQINTVIPAATASTTVDVTVSANGVTSNTVKLPIR